MKIVIIFIYLMIILVEMRRRFKNHKKTHTGPRKNIEDCNADCKGVNKRCYEFSKCDEDPLFYCIHFDNSPCTRKAFNFDTFENTVCKCQNGFSEEKSCKKACEDSEIEGDCSENTETTKKLFPLLIRESIALKTSDNELVVTDNSKGVMILEENCFYCIKPFSNEHHQCKENERGFLGESLNILYNCEGLIPLKTEEIENVSGELAKEVETIS
jgi:hypothetical protein